MNMPAFLGPLVDLIFPPRCPLCGDPLAQQGGLCAACWTKLAIPGDPCCSRCQRPLPDRPYAITRHAIRHDAGQEGSQVYDSEGIESLVCAPCLQSPPRHEGIAAATLYNPASRDLVLAFKHGRRIALAGLLARLMLAKIPPLEGEWLVIPVPLHRWRMWRRGFNQSALLAGKIAKALGQPLVVDGLVRIRKTPSLGKLTRRQRAHALAGAIAGHPARKKRLRGASVLLVDDVMTSGATTEACGKALRQARVAHMRIVCFARVLDEALALSEEGAPQAV